MNKKFKYKKSLLAAILSATLLAGCDGGGSGSSSDTPPVDSGTGSLPEVKPDLHQTRSRHLSQRRTQNLRRNRHLILSQHQNRSQNLFLRKRVIWLWAEACG